MFHVKQKNDGTKDVKMFHVKQTDDKIRGMFHLKHRNQAKEILHKPPKKLTRAGGGGKIEKVRKSLLGARLGQRWTIATGNHRPHGEGYRND